MERKDLALVAEPENGKALSIPQQQKEQLKNAAALAQDVAKIVKENGLAKRFGNSPKEHVFVEGWLTISRVNNEAPHAKVESVEHLGEYEVIKARAWITDAHGNVVSEADGYCSTEEGNWKGKPFYARASMAQTRAIGKAMRLRHAWVMVMAGFAPTPAEEMSEEILTPATAPAKPKVYKLKPDQKNEGDDAVPASVTDAAAPGEVVSSVPKEPLIMPEDCEIKTLAYFSKEKTDAKGKAYRGVNLGTEESPDWWNCYEKATLDNLSNLKGKKVYAELEVKGTFKLCHSLVEVTG